MSEPTRIIRKPEWVKPDRIKHQTSARAKILILACDDGCEYTIHQLAKLKGMSWYKLYWRLRHYPWDHPEILAEQISDAKKGGGTRLSGNPAWDRLGRDPRDHKLAALPPLGSFERQHCCP